MTQTGQSEDEFEVVAAEYVIGVLPIQERRALEARMDRDPAIRQQIELWEARLEDLNRTYGQLEVARGVKTRIDRIIFGDTPRRVSLRMWLLGAATGLVSAAVAIAVFFGSPQSVTLRATLAGDGGVLVASLDLQGSSLDINRAATRPPEGAVFELWVVRPDQPPRSLGTFLSAGTLNLRTALADGDILAISVEPLGGSPTGAPTGPVIATGVLQDV